jgi:hypothetical protein
MRRIGHALLIGFVPLLSVLGFAGAAVAQPPAAPPSKPQLVNTNECTPTSADGYQHCSSDKGTLRLVETPGAASFYRLDLTYVRELRQKGTAAYRGDEQHAELELTKKAAGAPANEFVRAGPCSSPRA